MKVWQMCNFWTDFIPREISAMIFNVAISVKIWLKPSTAPKILRSILYKAIVWLLELGYVRVQAEVSLYFYNCKSPG